MKNLITVRIVKSKGNVENDLKFTYETFVSEHNKGHFIQAKDKFNKNTLQYDLEKDKFTGIIQFVDKIIKRQRINLKTISDPSLSVEEKKQLEYVCELIRDDMSSKTSVDIEKHEFRLKLLRKLENTLKQDIRANEQQGSPKNEKWIFIEYAGKHNNNLLSISYFTEFNKLKNFSAKQSVYYKLKFPDYNSTYYKVEN